MERDGKYIYCIIASDYDTNFGPIGIGDRGDLVTTIGYDGLCMVVSDHSINDIEVNPKNILSHQKVIEEVMKEFNSILPLRFGNIAATPDEIRNLLSGRYREFMELLRTFENMVEINVKCTWNNIDLIFKEIEQENVAFKKIKEDLKKEPDVSKKNKKRAEAGKMVQIELHKKNEKEAKSVMNAFKRATIDYRTNKITNDATFFNTAFLVNSGREKEIDNIMTDIGEEYKDRIDFSYTGPMPIFNFIDLRIFPEKWETLG
ncbi:hypothetical protein PI23P_02392 [Polaribacter irgensii 23-P]|uniref:Gas vesicle synthesis GvpLGvpF n=1 Tax=Polaribacter irgensii 23-P TaxID=313594 RepID=A4BWG5_9FLAO|nr:GvpL/GvpF family gas vesicle protein [Polaribacter irgensii]EAR13306.1 hypothetical protein PI23P_02392 [Polaribacter irgensii 23-P]